jgi:glutathione S-transferase
MKLYGSLTSPYVRKVRMVLMEKGLAHDLVVEGPADAAGNVVRLNPLRAIPVLERDDGEVFFDSPMICEYLDSLNDKPRLYPASGEARWQVLRWHALGQGMMEATVARFVELRKPAEKQDAPTAAKHEARIAAALAFAAERVPASGFICGKTAPAFSALPPSMAVAGNTIGIADITLAVALGYIDLRYAHDWRGKHPKLASWFAAISQRPSFVETLAPELKK